ncbi:methionyl-tRNA formyltransferase [bacterium]|nr:methionyl-tRNA formyltransferase [bacterium]
MRVLFAGSPAIAVPALLEIAARHEIVGVLTNPESAQGRGKEILPTAVEAAAREKLGAGLPILKPGRLDAAARAAVAALAPDILVAFAYGKIFGPKFLALFPRGGINVHPSLLPRHRGSSPIQQAILDRDAETGVSVQALALEMDSGDLYAAERFPLSGEESAAALSERCAAIGARLAASVLDDIQAGRAAPRPQEGTPTYCRKIAKEDGRIDWAEPAAAISAKIRAFDPWPQAYTFLGGKRLNLLDAALVEASAAGQPPGEPAGRALPNPPPGTIIGMDKARGIVVTTGEGCLALRKLQFAAKKALSYKEFANGLRGLAGMRFADEP